MKKALKRMEKGESLQGIEIKARKITTTFWGNSWCQHLEKYSDYANRLPRGRTYARNGSIADLRITKGKITAMVCGSSLYDITITIDALPAATWKSICRDCSTSIHSLMDLMRGKLGDEVIRRITEPTSGMFPSGKEIKLRCSCPDGAYLCKHLAATLYGVGHRLDTAPELLFLLRGVDQNELISQAITAENATSAMGLDGGDGGADFVGEDLGAMFGIEMAGESESSVTAVAKKVVKKKAVKKKAAKKKAAKKKVVKKTAVKKAAVKKTAVKKTAVKRVKKTSAAPKSNTKKKATKKPAKTRASKKAKSAPKEIVIRFG